MHVKAIDVGVEVRDGLQRRRVRCGGEKPDHAGARASHGASIEGRMVGDGLQRRRANTLPTLQTVYRLYRGYRKMFRYKLFYRELY